MQMASVIGLVGVLGGGDGAVGLRDPLPGPGFARAWAGGGADSSVTGSTTSLASRLTKPGADGNTTPEQSG